MGCSAIRCCESSGFPMGMDWIGHFSLNSPGLAILFVCLFVCFVGFQQHAKAVTGLSSQNWQPSSLLIRNCTCLQPGSESQSAGFRKPELVDPLCFPSRWTASLVLTLGNAWLHFRPRFCHACLLVQAATSHFTVRKMDLRACNRITLQRIPGIKSHADS